MTKQPNTFRFIQSKWVPLILAIIFTIAFYIAYFTLLNQKSIPAGIMDFSKNYAALIPWAIWIIILIVSYFLILIKFILRLNFWIVHLLIFLIIYTSFLAVWIQLRYYEPRYTDIAIFIIDSYSMPLIIASIAPMITSLVFVFFRRKDNKSIET